MNFPLSFHRPWLKAALVLAGLLSLTACDSGPTMAEKIQVAQTLAPIDAQINDIYQRSCKSCHTLEETGAPLVGDQHEWSIRLDKGKDELIANVINGFGGMPPFGMCMECSPEQFEKLVAFMAQTQL